MVQAVKREHFIREEEYLAAEREGKEKHEWYQGECFAMAGGTRWHNMLSARIIAALVEHLDSTPCTPYMADLRLFIEAHQHYVYPDIMVVCDESSYLADDMVNNAEIILEVLSKGTESYDRGQKFLHYQSVSLLREYILVSQDAMQVEIYRRREGGRWEYQRLARPADVLFFETIDCSILLEKLYRSIPL
jgi:Uma2 family endonuclease